jgi:hypothetical protein
VKQRDPFYVADMQIYHIFIWLTQNNAFYIGKMKEFPEYNKYDAFIEEPLDPTIENVHIEEVEAVTIYKLGLCKTMYIKAEDFHKASYLLPPTTKIRIYRKPDPFQYHFVKALEKIF